MNNPATSHSDAGRDRVQRYIAITLIATPANLVAYITILAVTDWRAWVCNVASATALAPPTFVAYRRWAWKLEGRASLRREILPYWIFTILNVTLASCAVAVLQAVGVNERSLWVVPICVYTVVWIVRYPVLNALLGRAKPVVAST